ncbi:cAMP-binding domain of CRP or a regulatory subunit of cAMP-dependent protein kinases [Tenacibaculum sp. MAR_2009_124]|uniref:Crp/Fnr family transcriptional regulator n=1 Tax=Tenacibaculum sp. MAR_2009_124 TaxID=1250059 RepID=UPI0008993C02|nr:Crp/Fnr family transcriptional regulator [Tenacibaculum sp. MAR_2009_124]SEC90005.1 cAMP-binding domain of CRP or a regulatory subunit of cAMP-dependent protein kinases [Tenacibaculum sp. MAR_2009_124]
MQHNLEHFVRYFMPNISDYSLNLFSSITIHKHFSKGKVIIKQGQVPTNFYILTNGVARSFIKNNNNREHTRTIYTAMSTCGALSSLISESKSNATYECLTDCDCLMVNFKKLVKITKSNHEMSLLYSKVMEKIFIRTEERVDELALLNATERYLKLKKDIPEIDNLIPQYHIASFLNVTPVQLSRIRKKLYSV